MHTSRLLCAAAVSAGLMATAFGMTNADVIKMKKAGFSDDTILLSIRKDPAGFDTSADALIELKEAGVSEAVIQRVMAAGRSGETAAAAPAPAPAGEATPAAAATPSAGGGSGFASQDLPSIAPPLITPVAGKEYFLRSTIHVEGGEYAATNYARGVVVPINTPVRLEVMSGKEITLTRIDTGERIKVENVEKYTRKSTPELARLLLADQKTPLESLPSDLASFIRSGDMRKGMTKEQVLMARGYPPAHETPHVELDRWVYWSSRFVKQTIVFTNGRLSEGRGIY